MPDCIMFSESLQNVRSVPGNYIMTRCFAMKETPKETPKETLQKYIESLEEYQLHILLGFVENLFPNLRTDG